jgi:predicted nucleic acid-binding protein
VIAVDTNILIYAHRSESIWNALAVSAIGRLAQTSEWAIPWPCLAEFYNIVTHPRRYKPPTPPARALAQLESMVAAPSLKLLSETSTKLGWDTFRDLVATSRVVGPAVHDARIASICIQHGVEELWTADRDYSRFPQLRVRNPLIPTGVNEPRGRYKLGVAELKKQPRAR